MTIHEPATLATDYLLALVAGGLAWRLHRCTSIASPAVRGWVWTFGFTALSAIVGGSYHGFAPNFSDRLLHGWWLGTLWLVSLSSAAMATSWVHEVLPPAGRRLGFVLVGLRLLAFAALAVARPTFAVVILDYGSSLLLWLGAALLLHRAWRGWMLTGLAFSVIAALVQQLRLAPGEHFNHNDLYHLIQALGLVAFSRAATRLESV
jgi:hypothetical protein